MKQKSDTHPPAIASGDVRSNYHLARDALLDHVPSPPGNALVAKASAALGTYYGVLFLSPHCVHFFRYRGQRPYHHHLKYQGATRLPDFWALCNMGLSLLL